MQNIFITQFSIGFISPALLSLVISGTILLREIRKRCFTPDRTSLALYFFGASVYNVLNFLGFSIYSPDAQIIWYIESFVPFMVIFMIRFAYYYPDSWHETERKVVLISASIFAVAAISEYWVNSWESPVLLFGHTYGSKYHSGAIPLIVALFYTWAASVFIRRAIDYEKKNEYYKGFITAIIKPVSREAKTARTFAALIFLDIIHAFIQYGVMNRVSVSSFSISFTITILLLVIYSLYAVVYLHSAYDNIPVIYELTGLPLVLSLLMVTAGGYIMMYSRSISYDEMNLVVIQELKADKISGRNTSRLPVSYISTAEDSAWNIIYDRDGNIPEAIQSEIWKEAPSNVQIRRGSDIRDLNRLDPGRKYFIKIEKINYTQYHLRIGEKVYGFGFPYIDYLKYMHKTGHIILIVMIISMMLIITILPALYYFGLIGPLRRIINSNSEKNESLYPLENELYHIEKILKNLPENRKVKPLPGKPVEISASVRVKLDEIVSYLKENYHDDISREGLAAMIDLDTDYISRLFRIYTGIKIGDYINKLRIEEASRLLIESDKSVLDISLIAGFESLRTFNRAFIKVTGVSPTSFRNNMHKKTGI